MCLSESRRNTVEARSGCLDVPCLFRPRVDGFQLPQTIPAFRGNQLNPKREMHFVIRSLKAGDFGAFGAGLLSLTSLDPNWGVRYSRVSHHAIGTGCQKASLRTLRFWSATWHCQLACLSQTPQHCSPFQQIPIDRNNASQRLSSLSREGKSKLLPAGHYIFPKHWIRTDVSFRSA